MMRKFCLLFLGVVFLAGCLGTGGVAKDDPAAIKSERMQQEKATQAFEELDNEFEENRPAKEPKISRSSMSEAEISGTSSESEVSESPTEDYSSSRYIKATGIGQTDAEARRMCKVELSGIFESKIQSEVISNTKSITSSTQGEQFQKNIEANIRVLSATELKGVLIGKTWYDEKNRAFYAEAVLDKYKARDEWNHEIARQEAVIEAEYKNLEAKKSPYTKLQAIKKILSLWVETEVISSRLRVIGFPDQEVASDKIRSVIEIAPKIKSSMNIYLDIAGQYSGEVMDEIAKKITQQGFKLSENRKKADVLISGDLKVTPVDLKNPDYKFARAIVTLDIVDLLSNATVGKISQNVRKGHINFNEAEHMAVQKISQNVAAEIVKQFSI